VQHSNAYIIGFAAAVCVVCGFLVSVTATSLKTRQDQNILLDRQKNVLTVAGLMRPGEDLDSAEASQRFEDSIQARVVTLATGEEAAGIDAERFDQRRAAKDPERSRRAPPNASKVLRLPNEALVYEVIEGGETQALILPIQGMGLWSVLYGYIALESDARTIRGITYYQHRETAGLGGEVDNPRWKALWVGRKAFDERGKVKIEVKKGAAGPADKDPYRVDGLAGATITSRGVTNMLRFWLGDSGFAPYLHRYREQRGI
jgi:Na+-transporting NADH:ubiquinone oxidoreductase subunit C